MRPNKILKNNWELSQAETTARGMSLKMWRDRMASQDSHRDLYAYRQWRKDAVTGNNDLFFWITDDEQRAEKIRQLVIRQTVKSVVFYRCLNPSAQIGPTDAGKEFFTEEFQQGQRVRVSDPSCSAYGQIGTVRHIMKRTGNTAYTLVFDDGLSCCYDSHRLSPTLHPRQP